MRILIFLFVLFGASRAAGADDANGVGVVVTGDATLQPQLGAELETWLRDHGHVLVPAALPADAISSIIDCFVLEDEACARAVVDQRGRAQALVFARVDVTPARDGTRNVTLTGYWFQKGREAIADRRYCEGCTDDNLRTTADHLMRSLSRSGHNATGTLRITSSPPGAKVVIDGQPVGVTPLDYDLVTGTHQVTLSADRRAIEAREVAIRSGETSVLDVPLAPMRDDAGRGLRPLPLGLVAGGVVALGSGIVLIAIDEDPSPTGPLYIRDTATAGMVLAGIGGVALAAGLYVWLRGADNSHPVASATRDGGSLGWRVRF